MPSTIPSASDRPAGQSSTSGGWTAVCSSSELGSGPRAALVGGRAIVVWRSSLGRAVAFDDWCPHQGNRLSDGAVLGTVLRCAGHGWEFGTDGWCERAGIATAVHEVDERDGEVRVRVRPGSRGPGQQPSLLNDPLSPLNQGGNHAP